MKKLKLTDRQRTLLYIMCTQLFPEFKYIFLEKDNVRFSGLRKNSIKNGIASLFNIQNTVKIPIFELLITKFPERLSIRKSGNKSFATIYLIHAMYMINIDTDGIIDYFYNVFDSIKKPFNVKKQIADAIKEARYYDEREYDPEFEFTTLKDKVEAINNEPSINSRKMRQMTIREARSFE